MANWYRILKKEVTETCLNSLKYLIWMNLIMVQGLVVSLKTQNLRHNAAFSNRVTSTKLRRWVNNTKMEICVPSIHSTQEIVGVETRHSPHSTLWLQFLFSNHYHGISGLFAFVAIGLSHNSYHRAHDMVSKRLFHQHHVDATSPKPFVDVQLSFSRSSLGTGLRTSHSTATMSKSSHLPIRVGVIILQKYSVRTVSVDRCFTKSGSCLDTSVWKLPHCH